THYLYDLSDPTHIIMISKSLKTTLSLAQYIARMNIQLLKATDLNEMLHTRGVEKSVTVQKICTRARKEAEAREMLGGWSSAGGAVGLGAGFPSLHRFFAGFFPFFLDNISPTYRLSQIADKALIFDGNIALRKLRSCLAWNGGLRQGVRATLPFWTIVLPSTDSVAFVITPGK